MSTGVVRPTAEDTRQRILAAALVAFADRSFDGASTRQIAELAGVTQPLLHHHFGSKLDLWKATVDELFSRLREVLDVRRQGLRGVDDRTTAELVVREFVTFSARHPQLHRILTQECKADNDRIDWLVDRHVRPLHDATTAMFRRLVAAGHLPDIGVEHLYYILTGAGPTMFVLAPECRRLSGVDPSDPAVVEAHADAVVALLFGRPTNGGTR